MTENRSNTIWESFFHTLGSPYRANNTSWVNDGGENGRQTLMHDVGYKIHSPIFVTFDEAKTGLTKSPGLLSTIWMTYATVYGKTHQWMYVDEEMDYPR